ncbi:MAG: SUMF1/EgtB/PvdO family nonheme iron enzyme [Planctomycetota bacterium]
MKRTAQALLTVVALILVAADPPSNQKPVSQDDPAEVREKVGEAATGVHARPSLLLCDDPETVAFLKRFATLTLWNGHVDKITIIQTMDAAKLAPYIKRLPRVRELRLYGKGATDSLMALVKDLPGLITLMARDGEVTDVGLANLEGAASILMLSLQGNKNITGAGLAHLRRLTDLRNLNLSHTGVDDMGLESLKQMKQLLSLNLSETQVTDCGLENLKQMKGLHHLDLSDTQVTDRGLQRLSDLTKIHSLKLNRIGITDTGLVHLNRMKEIRELTFRGTKVTSAGVKPLQELNPWINITVGDGEEVFGTDGIQRKQPESKATVEAPNKSVGDNRPQTAEPKSDSRPNTESSGGNPAVPVDDPEAIAILRRVGSLALDKDGHVYFVSILNGNVDPTKVAPYLKRLPKLRELELPTQEATDFFMGLAKDLPGLERLTAHRGEVTDAGLASLESATDLRKLDLQSNRNITGAGLVRLRRLAKMEYLDLSQTQIDNAGLENLKEMKSLLYLYLSDSKVSDRGLQHLSDLTKLEILILNSTGVTDQGLQHLSSLTKLHILNLNSTGVTDAGLVYLRGMKDLRVLSCRGTKVTKAGAKPLSKQYPWMQITVGDGEGLFGASEIQRKKLSLKAATEAKELTLDLGQGIKLEMVLIPAGKFMMGSPDSDTQAETYERPQHRVRITKPFYLGKYLVTQEQWEAVMRSNPSEFKGPRNPVENVTWDDCKQFLEKLNAKFANAKGKFRLPSEAQWEYACRAGTTTRYFCGDDMSKFGQFGWYRDNSDGRTHPVGEKKPNPWGLYDMCGNVAEWCQDWCDNQFYARSPVDDPAGPATGDFREFRGGSFCDPAEYCRSAFRDGKHPLFSYSGLGLRVLWVVAPQGQAATIHFVFQSVQCRPDPIVRNIVERAEKQGIQSIPK